ncbi:hypothetical protein MRB53_012241 [Persea americana]|uniref:Uncharacterized protein n=1 Tax=Persea americana TaxID=3435 RepID=A0ACC2LX08_PERAE|nr:hypothetical protein MRB53_012241 [Persea americana]
MEGEKRSDCAILRKPNREIDRDLSASHLSPLAHFSCSASLSSRRHGKSTDRLKPSLRRLVSSLLVSDPAWPQALLPSIKISRWLIAESRLPPLNLDIYVPRDERFRHLKMSDFLAYALKSLVQFLVPEIKALCDSTPNEFDTFQDVLNLYEGGIKLPDSPALDKIRDMIPLEMIKELVRTDGERLLKFPLPQVIKGMYNVVLTLEYNVM